MYKWYGNCQAVVLDSGTALEVWCSRGWCLQEGAAAGTLYGIVEEPDPRQEAKKPWRKLVSMQALAKRQNVNLCRLDLSLYYRTGNAVEILAKMDQRQTKRKEDMAYALMGIFSVHMSLAYGEKEMARERLLHELATQKGDLSCLSFSANGEKGTHYLPMSGCDLFTIAQCRVASSPATLCHFGLTIQVQLVDGSTAEQVMARLASLKLLKIRSQGRYVGIDQLIDACKDPRFKKSTVMYMAIIRDICSIMLIEEYDQDVQTGGGVAIKCCFRSECCQVDREEFERLFSNIDAEFERIWLGRKPVDGGFCVRIKGLDELVEQVDDRKVRNRARGGVLVGVRERLKVVTNGLVSYCILHGMGIL